MLKEKLYEITHKKPAGTEAIVKLWDIKIPPDFTKWLPSRDKINAKVKYYKEHKTLEHPIVVMCVPNEKGRPNKLMLVDGYIGYLILLFNGEETAPVKYL